MNSPHRIRATLLPLEDRPAPLDLQETPSCFGDLEEGPAHQSLCTAYLFIPQRQ